uniref:F-box domain-containing protein n=3 Tax=Chenopodium quinoa TaxID=63459 RepID=A0A803LKE0_CHEQI
MSIPWNRRRLKDVDHISNLPDTILCHILSFLTTKSAVKTSILSYRWKYVWTKVPVLDFTEEKKTSGDQQHSLEQKICFKSFMDNVLLHNEASYIQRFCLNLSNADAFYVNSWLIAAARRKIHELNIILNQYMDICLPPRFLFSETLVVLNLHGSLNIGASVSFHLPNLETIHLRNLKFPDDEFMKKLSSNCPVLRELHIVNCVVKAMLCVDSLTLNSLLIKNTRTIHGLEQACIVIETSNLAYLCIHEFWVSSIDIGNMSSLIKADLCLDQLNGDEVEKVLTKVSGVETLQLRFEVFLLVTELPVFPNLTWLEYVADEELSKMLYCAPKLKSLLLKYFDCGDRFDPEFAPKHLPCLETVEICGFIGLVKELDTAEYFLKAASALKEMKINFHRCATDSDVTSFYQGLLDLPRSSAVCRVKITNPFCCKLVKWN